MKKYLFALLAILLCLSACSAPAADKPGTTETNPTASSAPETKPQATQPETTPTEPNTSLVIEPGYFPIPEEPAEFVFSSGAGAWKTVMNINKDSTFSGQYLDSEMGLSGEGYRSTCYICDFSGVFTDIQQINAYSCKTRITQVSTSYSVGEEWIEDDIRYIAANPAGIYDQEKEQLCEEFILYLPNTPLEEVPEEFLTWWPYQGEQKTTLSCYGLLNVTTNDGFFYIPEA